MYLIVREDGTIDIVKASITNESVESVVGVAPFLTPLPFGANQYSKIAIVSDACSEGKRHMIGGVAIYGDAIVARYGTLDEEYHSLKEEDLYDISCKIIE